jgi:hypothetical protein
MTNRRAYEAFERRLRDILLRRAEMARRWFGLKTPDEITDFVMRDPDIQANADEGGRMAFYFAVAEIVEGKDIEEWRQALGNEIVDIVLKVVEREGNA